jgi:RNA recognition motif-containing protein
MSYTVFLGNLPVWVTADDIGSWLTAENLVADSIKVIRNPETQESKGFAFIEAPNQEEMDSIIRRFNHAPLEDRLLRANPAQPPRGKGAPPTGPMGRGPGQYAGGDRGGPGGDRGNRPPRGPMGSGGPGGQGGAGGARRPSGGNGNSGGGNGGGNRRGRNDGPPSAFAEELAKAL